MTMTAEAPTGGISLPMLPVPMPNWTWARRNTVKVTYVSEGVKSHRTLVGRVTNVTPELVTILHEKTGEPTVLHRERIRGIVVMFEGDVAGRLRVVAVRALQQATRALADPSHVGGNQREAADLLAFVQEILPALKNGDSQRIWTALQTMGADLG
jgi:hypothetical protein